MKNYKNMKTNITSIFAAALVLFTASCANEETTKQNSNQETAAGTNFVGGSAVKTRTSLDVTLPGGTTVDYFWEPSDKIWTADGATGTAQITAKSATANFRMSKAYNTSTVDVYYPGVNATAYNQVTIATAQTQTAPNSTKHLGAAGDCGTATAHKQSDNSYKFDLDHKATYLCLLPRTPNKLVSTYISQVKITADNNIAGTYTLTNTGLTGSGSSKEITITTKSTSGTYANGFPLNNAVTSQSTNAIYAVIAPGTHALTIEYSFEDIMTGFGGTITKTIASTAYAENTVYPITANIKLTEYPGDNYYMWDAAVGQHYWKGHEWNKAGYVADVDQPVFTETTGSAYPQTNTDPRWYREDTSLPVPAANRSAKDNLNINEGMWYVLKGNPHWDDQALWAAMGHLYGTGIWFLKKANISGFSSTNYNGIDYRTTYPYGNLFDNLVPSQGKPSNLNDYFFLPALGFYSEGKFVSIGAAGSYWTSSAFFTQSAFNLYFAKTIIFIGDNTRKFGLQPWIAQ